MDLILGATFFISVLAFSYFELRALFFPLVNYFDLWRLFGTFDNYDNFIVLISLILATINFVGFTFIKNQNLHNTLMISFGVFMGTFFGIFFDSFSLLFVLVALALYDIYAVFRGPLKDMFDRLDMKSERTTPETTDNTTEPTEDNTTQTTFNTTENFESTPMGGISTTNSTQTQETSFRVPRNVKNPQISRGFTLPVYATPFITIGLGDFAFFSILIAKATYLAIKGDFLILPATANGSIYWSMIVFPFIGLIVGCYLTFVLLQKYEMLPALPLPISGGLIGLFLAMLLQLLL